MGQHEVTSTRPRVRIEIDLNARDTEGRVPAYLADADGYVAVGDTVTAFESEDEVAAPAVVCAVAHGVAYLDVKWDELADDILFPVAHLITEPDAPNTLTTSSAASWIPVQIKKMVTPVLATAAAVAAVTGVSSLPAVPQNTTAAPNAVSMRDIPPPSEAGNPT